MTEPRARATRLEPVVDGVWRWWVADDRLDGAESDAYAVVRDGIVTLVDPLPVADEGLLRRLGSVESIVLSASCHQRSAWRYRTTFQAPVYAPEGARGLEQHADHSYASGDLLPGGLVAFHTPGPVEEMYALWRHGAVDVVFLSDLLSHYEGRLAFLADEWQDEPARTRVSVRRVLDQLPLEIACFNHGPPLLRGAAQALARVLEDDARAHARPPP